MGKPAARMGDMTSHGGTITLGCMTVLIGGQPAARVGDMHVCPMVTGVVPHVGGPILPPGVPTVLIGGVPAACVGDQATCVGPPDAILPPGCPTVLIGSGGGGGGGFGTSGGGNSADAKVGGAGQTQASTSSEAAENHYLDVSFVDKSGKPITGVAYKATLPGNKTTRGTVSGKVRHGGIPAGNAKLELKTITKAAWSTKRAKLGDKVKLQLETIGVDDGTEARFEVIVRNANFPDKSVTELTADVSGNKAEVDWTLELDQEILDTCDSISKAGGIWQPSFFYRVNVDGLNAHSQMLEYLDEIEIKLKDEEGNPVKKAKYRVVLGNGEVRSGQLDNNGWAKLDNIPPGKVKVSFDI